MPRWSWNADYLDSFYWIVSSVTLSVFQLYLELSHFSLNVSSVNWNAFSAFWNASSISTIHVQKKRIGMWLVWYAERDSQMRFFTSVFVWIGSTQDLLWYKNNIYMDMAGNNLKSFEGFSQPFKGHPGKKINHVCLVLLTRTIWKLKKTELLQATFFYSSLPAGSLILKFRIQIISRIFYKIKYRYRS